MIKRLTLFVIRSLLLFMTVAAVAHADAIRPGDTPVLPVLTTLDGKTINPASLRGKVLVISYFASYCRSVQMRHRNCKSSTARIRIS